MRQDDDDNQDNNQQSSCETTPTRSRSGMSVIVLKRTVADMCSRIFRVLGPGFREAVYEKALEVELNLANITYVCQAPVPTYYLNVPIGIGYADIIVDNQLVLELKAAKTAILPGHLNQCRGYMRSMHLEHGLVINFSQCRSREQDIEVFDCFLGGNYPVKGPPHDKEAEKAVGPGPNRQVVDVEAYEAKQMRAEELDGGVTPLGRHRVIAPPAKRLRPLDDNDSGTESWFDLHYRGSSSTSVSVTKQ